MLALPYNYIRNFNPLNLKIKFPTSYTKILLKTNQLYLIILAFIILTSFLIRTSNLNYNSAFNDEAIYIVIGRMGLFQGDWVSYNPSAWVAGHPYFYPSLTAIANSAGGLYTSRLVNVVIGILLIELVFAITLLLYPIQTNFKYFGGIIAAFLIGGSSLGYYISRLATYDIPSFYLLFLSIALLLIAQSKNRNVGKFYFFSALTLFLSFLFKITSGIYIPFILIIAFFTSRKISPLNHSFFKKYFFVPLALGLIGFVATNLTGLVSFYNMQINRENYTPLEILSNFWDNTALLSGFFLMGTLGMFINRQFKKWVLLTGGIALIIIFHIATQRLSTFDKHLFISSFFIALIAGIGIPPLINLFKSKIYKIFLYSLITLSLALYWHASFLDSARFNSIWPDSRVTTNFITSNTHYGDKILTEVGASTILDVYETNPPVNTTTFDFFQYGRLEGKDAYIKAVKDGYFNLIQLESDTVSKEKNVANLSHLIRENLSENYQLSFNNNDFLIYTRKF